MFYSDLSVTMATLDSSVPSGSWKGVGEKDEEPADTLEWEPTH